MAMADDAANGGLAVTPNDGADLPQGVTSGLYVGGAGNVVVSFSTTTRLQVTITAPAVGFVLPVKVVRVYATGTTATGLIAMY